jgi:hypothetical protein
VVGRDLATHPATLTDSANKLRENTDAPIGFPNDGQRIADNRCAFAPFFRSSQIKNPVRVLPFMPTEADTCRKIVVPKLPAAGWDNDPNETNAHC